MSEGRRDREEERGSEGEERPAELEERDEEKGRGGGLDDPAPEVAGESAVEGGGRDSAVDAERVEGRGRGRQRRSDRREDRRPRRSGFEEELPGVGGAASASETLIHAKETVETIFTLLGLDAKVEVRDSPERIACQVELAAEERPFGILSAGQVVAAVEHIAQRIVNRGREGRKRLAIYLGELPAGDPDPAMVAMASRLGESAKRMGKRLTVVPMHAGDRKIIHQAASEVEGMVTRSEGEGNLRRLVVLVKGEE